MEKIGANAFEGIRGIKKLIIPEGVTFIGYKAFYDSTIVEVELPKSIKIIQLSKDYIH